MTEQPDPITLTPQERELALSAIAGEIARTRPSTEDRDPDRQALAGDYVRELLALEQKLLGDDDDR